MNAGPTVPVNAMKSLAITLSFAATLAVGSAALITAGSGTLNQVVPDNNPSGWQNTITISGWSGYTVTDVNVVLNITGGWNGDLYGYLVHDTGFAVLLDRVGKTLAQPYGYSNSGFSVTLDDSVATGIHNASGSSYTSTAAITGTWASQSGNLSSFNTTAVNGSWTLFLADLSFGDTSTVGSWSLEITAVPEPTTWAAIIFGGLFGAVQMARRFRKA